jgi:UbiD family decarboxylase
LWSKAKEAGQDLEVAISIGLHPAVLLAAASAVPFGVSEFGVASAFLCDGFSLTKCENISVRVPAEAEIVLEGKLSVEEEVVEGPLVDLTGSYDIQRKQPTIRLVGMMHRREPIYQALLPSGVEHKLLMGLPRETKIWEAVSKVVPTVKAVNLTRGGCGWLHAVVSIEKQTDGDGKNVLLAALAGHPSLKHAVVVDSDINVYNLEEVEWAVATRFQAKDDLLVVQNVRGSSLDPSADQETGLTTKVGLDATVPLTEPRERFERAKIPFNKRIKGVIDEIRSAFK